MVVIVLILSVTTATPTFDNAEFIVSPCLEVVEGHKEVWIIILLARQQIFFGHPFGTKDVVRGVWQGSALEQGLCNRRQTY